MSIEARCDRCEQRYRVADKLSGKRVKCRQCGAAIAVPILLGDPVDNSAEFPPVADTAAPAPRKREGSITTDSLTSNEPLGPAGKKKRWKGRSGPKGPGRPSRVSGLQKGRLILASLVAAAILVSLAVMLSRWPAGSIGGGRDTQEQPAFSPGSYPFPSIAKPTFPPRGSLRPLRAGIQFCEVRLHAPSGTPGHSGKLYVYMPPGQHGPRSLPCVLIAPAGAYCFSGMGLGSGDQPEHLPYVLAGFVVVAYEIDGEMHGQSDPAARRAYDQFSAAQAGLVNSRNALEWVLAKMPEVDPKRIYTAGHSSAAMLALLFAEHEPRLQACAAYAPATNVPARMEEGLADLEPLLPGCREFFQQASPHTHADGLRCPVFLFHARDDSNVPVQDAIDFSNQLKRLGKKVTLEIVSRGDHYDSMVQQGIPRAIRWLQELDGPRARVAQVKPPVAQPRVAQTTPSSPRRPRIRRPPAAAAKPPESPRPTVWQVQPDPLPQPIGFPSDPVVAIPFQASSFMDKATVLYPSGLSPFVAVGNNSRERDVREVWNMETLQRTGGIRGDVDGSAPWRLSNDGRYLACRSEKEDNAVDVWSFETGSLAATVRLGDDHRVAWFDFPAVLPGKGDQLLTQANNGSIQVWSLPAGEVVHRFQTPSAAGSRSSAISPGGKYLAMTVDTLQIYELATGKLVGDVAVPKEKGSGSEGCRALVFSPDATELVAVLQTHSTQRLLCWDLSNGRIAVSYDFSGSAPPDRSYGSGYLSGKHLIEWIPEKTGWLIDGIKVVERMSGRVLWSCYRAQGEKDPRRLLGGRYVMAAVGVGRDTRVLGLIEIPLKGLQAAAAAVRAGGEPVDSESPALTPRERDAARIVSLPPGEVPWSVTVDPAGAASGPFDEEPLSLGRSYARSVAFSDPSAGRAVTLAGSLAPAPANLRWAMPHRIDCYDLFGVTRKHGKRLAHVEVPTPATLIDVDSAGRMAALQLTDTRLDVWSIDEGKHVCGWRPGGEVSWARFVDEDHLLVRIDAVSSGPNGEVGLWRLPECRAIYTVEIEGDTTVFCTPGRKYLVVFHGGRYVFLNASTGEAKGALAVPNELTPLVTPRRRPRTLDTLPELPTRLIAFTSDAREMATLVKGRFGRALLHWDLGAAGEGAGRLVSEVPLPKLGSLVALQWCGPRQLLAKTSSQAYLIDLDRKAVTWRYRYSNGYPLPAAADGRQWTIVRVPSQNPNFLAAYTHRDDAVQAKIEAALPKDPAPLIGPDVPVSIDVSRVSVSGAPSDFRQKLEAALRAALQKAGLSVGTGQGAARMVASCRRGESETQEYRMMFSTRGGPSEFTVTSTGLKMEVQLISGGKTVWEKHSETLPGSFGMMERIPENVNPVTHFRKMENENHAHSVEHFLASVRPPRLMYDQPVDSEGNPGLGETVVDLKAMFRVETSPVESRGNRGDLRLPRGMMLPEGIETVGRPSRGSSGAPSGDAAQDEAYEKASLHYTRQAHVDSIAGSDAVLAQRLRWFPAMKRPSIGIRWGVGLQMTGIRKLPDVHDPRSLAKVTGPAIPAIGDRLQQRLVEGKFGDWPPTGNMRFRRVDFLGIGKQAELVAAAARRGLHALAMASLTVQPIGLTGRTDTRMTLRLIDVPTRKVLWVSKMLSSGRVATAEKAGGDPMGELVHEVMEQVDEQFVLVPMPALKPAHVKRRLDGLFKDDSSAADDPQRLLPVLAELRYYQSKQLLSAREAILFYGRIVGADKGRILATGDSNARRAVLAEWLK